MTRQAYIDALVRLALLLQRNGYVYQCGLLNEIVTTLHKGQPLAGLCSNDIWGGSGSVTDCNLRSQSGPQTRELAEHDEREFYTLIAQLAQWMDQDSIATDRVRSVGVTFARWCRQESDGKPAQQGAGPNEDSAIAPSSEVIFPLGRSARVMDSENWTQGYDETVALISRWRGSKAIAWQYIAGHGPFLLRLVQQDGASRRSAYLQCGDCQELQLFRTEWADADISISFAPHRLGTVFTITDPGRLHLVCWSVFATESERGVFLEYPLNTA